MTNQKKENIRLQFPFFTNHKNKNVVYFDNAATTQKPQLVIDAIVDFYSSYNSNIHRSSHHYGALATRKYEQARLIVQEFISAKKSDEIIFTSGATDSINLVANSYVRHHLKRGDIILTSPIEHHANILPWQMIAKETGAMVKTIPLNKNLQVDINQFKQLVDSRVKFIAIQQMSNISGVEQDIKQVTTIAHNHNIPVLVDGAQSVAHKQVNVDELDCDFYCFSGHKIFGPTATGVLYGKIDLLKKMVPSKVGGGMVKDVLAENSTFHDLPYLLEAGTPNIGGVIGLGKAIKFIGGIGFETIKKREYALSEYLLSSLKELYSIDIYSSEQNLSPILAFNIKGLHHYDIATILAGSKVLIRSGELCSQPFMKYLNMSGCLRASLSFYNTFEEVDLFILALKKAIKLLKK